MSVCVCTIVCVCVYNCVHKTAPSGSVNLPSYPPDNHQSSDVCQWEGSSILLVNFSQISDKRVIIFDKIL